MKEILRFASNSSSSRVRLIQNVYLNLALPTPVRREEMNCSEQVHIAMFMRVLWAMKRVWRKSNLFSITDKCGCNLVHSVQPDIQEYGNVAQCVVSKA